ncbi:MAG: 4Fe-4S dicluster domain-containing protein [Acidobacteria bacterium]|nr:4Fe-4S dicluster domain-containing protein [Acidobacteriota bacterium]MCB9377153.1 4Fe-4S dicluster domain-containing protein [Holophagales bacterium]
MTVDRRRFLADATKFLLLAGAAREAWPFVAEGRPQDAPGYEAARHWWAMFIDIEKCIGCGLCVDACKRENDVPDEPYYFRTWVERYQIPPRDVTHPKAEDHPIVDSPNGGRDGFPTSHDQAGGKSFFVPKLCNHCAHSPCVQVCPVGATFESPDGVVLVDKQYCLGCRYCVQACPYGCRYIDPRTNTVDKCTLCYHRITKGLTTACCEVCPTGARQLGDLRNPDDPIHELLRTHKVQVLKPSMATGAKVYYNGMDAAVR